jgi:hypothetical protein
MEQLWVTPNDATRWLSTLHPDVTLSNLRHIYGPLRREVSLLLLRRQDVFGDHRHLAQHLGHQSNRGGNGRNTSTYTHTHTHTDTPAHTHTHTYTHTRTYTHTYTHTLTHIHTHTHAHAHAHAHAHTAACADAGREPSVFERSEAIEDCKGDEDEETLLLLLFL